MHEIEKYGPIYDKCYVKAYFKLEVSLLKLPSSFFRGINSVSKKDLIQQRESTVEQRHQ